MKKENGAERKRGDLVMTHFLGRTLGGEIEIQKAHGGKDQKLTLSGGEARQRRTGDVEKLGMMRGLTGEMRID